MPILLWSQIVEVTHDEAKQDLLDLLDSVGFTATSWQEGSVPLAMVEIGAEIWSKLSGVAVFLKGMALNETAEGEGLTRFSASHYANTRRPSTTAQRKITLTCSATEGPHSIALGAVVLANSVTGKTVRNVAGLAVVYPATLPSGGTLQLLFEAESGGSGHNLANGSYTSLVTTLAGVTVSEDLRDRDGTDEESDPLLKVRNSSKWALLTEFELIKDAVENIALNAHAGIKIVGVDDNNPRGAGTFDVYLAGDTTTFLPGAQEIVDAQAAFDKRVFGPKPPAADARCLVKEAAAAPLDLAGSIFYDGNFAQADVKAAVEAALIAFLKTIPLGGFDFSPGPAATVPKNDIESVIKETTIGGQKPVKTVQLTTPLADLSVASFSKVTQGTWSTLVYSAVVNG